MGRFCLLTVLLLAAQVLAFAQDTISVDATSAMHVCSDKYPASLDPCASPPRAVSKVGPTYPEKSRQARSEGTVVLGLIVGKDGAAHDVHLINGVDDDINQAAIAAVSHWTFEPATYEGKPVAVEMNVQVNFRLDANASAAPATASGGSPNSDVRNLYSDAEAAYKREDYQTAANLARRIIALSPQSGSAWNLLGLSLLDMHQPDAAATALETQIKVDSGSTFAYNNLGRVYWRQRRYEDAEAQFRKQIVINPRDHYAHGNLGMMLRDEKKCSDAMPELEKALEITPNHAEVWLARGECDIDLGNRVKGLSELEQAISASSAPNIWNSAAYILAKRNIELERAEKWSETSLTVESARLRAISLEHLTIEQLNYVYWISSYWDTRGYIYFLRGDNNNAQPYLEASWPLEPHPATGGHLGQLYEKMGRPADAIRLYAMAIAAADLPSRAKADPDDVADAKQRLTSLAGPAANVASLIARGRTDLVAMNVISFANPGKLNGDADFTIRIAAGNSVQARQISGDSSLAKFSDALQGARLSIRIPSTAPVEIPLRGSLSCHAQESECRFAVLSPEVAVDLARKEQATDIASVAETPAADPHVYNDPKMGMRISLPDEWKLIREDPGSFSQPHNVMFGKLGSTAMFMLTRERLEGTQELYKKMLESGLSRQAEFKRNGEQAVTRDGLPGTRWSATWNANGGIAYSAVMEFFTVGDDHYRMTAVAPHEIYDRYAETFENMLRSVQFPMLRVDPKLQGEVKDDK